MLITAPRVALTREDPRQIIKAYHAAKDPLARGKIWAEELRPHLDAAGELPIQADNALGTLAGNLVLQRALDLLAAEFPLLSELSTDFSGETIKFGRTVYTRLINPPEVKVYDPVTGYATRSDANDVDVPVVVDQHVYVAMEFRVETLGGTPRDLFDEHAKGIQYALGEAIYASVYANLTKANFANETVSAALDFGRSILIRAGGAMSKRKVPRLGRYALLSVDYHNRIEEDQTVVSVANNPDGRGAITTGRLPVVRGFQPHECVTLPTGENLTGFFGVPASLAIASRVPDDYTQTFGPGGAQAQVVTNAVTGLSVFWCGYANHDLGAAIGRAAIMYGSAKGDPATGQRLVSAATA